MTCISDNAAHIRSIANELWDTIIIGTGVGGATIGYRLAKEGHRVLFIEKGKAHFSGPRSMDERQEDAEKRLESAYWPNQISMRVNGRESEIFAPLGCGVGGTSHLYAATLERFEPSDLEPTDDHPHPTGGWPIRWDDLLPYYEEAERLYRVFGTPDPLSDQPQHMLRLPPSPSAVDRHFMQAFSQAGLDPYRLHVGFGYKPGCLECGGQRCERTCRSDARSVCLDPAMRTGCATLLPECEVVRLDADSERVRSVICRHEGQHYSIRGKTVVLAAGAYHSPAILLRSRNSAWPNGLANRSGMVGRNLMFHANEWIAIWPKKKAAVAGPRKVIGIRNFYIHQGKRLGILQSTGLSAGYSEIYSFILTWFDRGHFRRIYPLRPLLRIIAKIGTLLLGRATIFTMIIEDFPHRENRVSLDENDPARIRVSYDVPDELRDRTRTARRSVRRALNGLKVLPLQIEVQLNYGHPCGTCCFGHNPSESVLDANCKAHEVDNLYVVDASFMPSSGGANPSLTIAANALRVGRALSDRLKEAIVPLAHRNHA